MVSKLQPKYIGGLYPISFLLKKFLEASSSRSVKQNPFKGKSIGFDLSLEKKFPFPTPKIEINK